LQDALDLVSEFLSALGSEVRVQADPNPPMRAKNAK
jgi:hypothetical protein